MRYKKPAREDLSQRSRRHYVKPLTLGDLAINPNIVVEAECEWCRHRAQLEIDLLIEKLGRDAECAARGQAEVFGLRMAHLRRMADWPRPKPRR